MSERRRSCWQVTTPVSVFLTADGKAAESDADVFIARSGCRTLDGECEPDARVHRRKLSRPNEPDYRRDPINRVKIDGRLTLDVEHLVRHATVLRSHVRGMGLSAMRQIVLQKIATTFSATDLVLTDGTGRSSRLCLSRAPLAEVFGPREVGALVVTNTCLGQGHPCASSCSTWRDRPPEGHHVVSFQPLKYARSRMPATEDELASRLLATAGEQENAVAFATRILESTRPGNLYPITETRVLGGEVRVKAGGHFYSVQLPRVATRDPAGFLRTHPFVRVVDGRVDEFAKGPA